jgi:putative DNA primase/helicase
MGSVAFTAVARVVLVAAKVNSDDGEERRILARSKSNIGPDDCGYEYTLDQGEPLPGIFASRVTWGASVSGTARELLTDPNEAQADDMSAIESARAFLLEVLKDGITPCKSIQAEAKAAGLSWSSICRASNLMVVVKKKGVDAWYWKEGVPDFV